MQEINSTDVRRISGGGVASDLAACLNLPKAPTPVNIANCAQGLYTAGSLIGVVVQGSTTYTVYEGSAGYWYDDGSSCVAGSRPVSPEEMNNID